MNYLVSPVFIIAKVIKHPEKFRYKGVLVVPYWLSAVSWPLIFETKNIYNPIIKETKVFCSSLKIITRDNNKNFFIGSDKFSSGVLALNNNFS